MEVKSTTQIEQQSSPIELKKAKLIMKEMSDDQ